MINLLIKFKKKFVSKLFVTNRGGRVVGRSWSALMDLWLVLVFFGGGESWLEWVLVECECWLRR